MYTRAIQYEAVPIPNRHTQDQASQSLIYSSISSTTKAVYLQYRTLQQERYTGIHEDTTLRLGSILRGTMLQHQDTGVYEAGITTS